MKTRKWNEEANVAQEGGGCCTPEINETKVSADPCCEQPEEGSACCDKSAPKEANSQKTGCC